MIDDATLLAQYARDRFDAAFAEFVQRNLPLVYSAAVRRTDGDAHRAKDIAQIVFTAAARDAAKLSTHPALTGWLYSATRSAAIDVLRAERRRRLREEKAHTMQEIDSSETPADWAQLRPVLDAAIDELDDRDREAVLLRFFQNQPLAGVANALRVSEDAARKRVDRALDKLGALLSRRGITSTGGALAAVLANQAVATVPAGVAASVTTAALAGATVGAMSASTTGIFIMSTSKVVTSLTAVIAAVAIGTAVYQAKSNNALTATITAERDELRNRIAASEQRSREADAKLATTEKELSDLRVVAAKPAAPARPASNGSGNAMVDYVLDHPETHGAYVDQQVLKAKQRFEPFLKTTSLSPAQREEFFNQIKDRSAAELDFMLALHQQGYGVGSLPQDPQARADLQKMATTQKEKFEGGMRGVLGDDGYRAYQQFGATLPERNTVDELGGQLYLSESPLTAQQAEQLAVILKQDGYNGQPTATPRTTMNGTLLTRQALMSAVQQVANQGGQPALDWHAPVTDAAVARAESVLSPAQIAALRQVQARQLAQFQLAPPPAANSPAAVKLNGGK